MSRDLEAAYAWLRLKGEVRHACDSRIHILKVVDGSIVHRLQYVESTELGPGGVEYTPLWLETRALWVNLGVPSQLAVIQHEREAWQHAIVRLWSLYS